MAGGDPVTDLPEGFQLDGPSGQNSAPQQMGPDLPPGFQVDEQQSSAQPDLPEGYQLDTPERTWGQEIGRDIRTFARGVLPTTAGVVGGIGAGALAAETGPGAIVAGLAGGAAAGFAAQKAQDKIADALGIDSPEARAADAENPNLGSRIAEFAPAAVTLGSGGLSTALSQRALSGGIMGAVDVGMQAATTGHVDPAEAIVAAGTGALLPTPRKWVPGGSAMPKVAGSMTRRSDANVNALETPPVEAAHTENASPTATSDARGTAQSKPQPLGYTDEHSGGMDATAGEFSAGTGDIPRDQKKTAVAAAEGIQGATDNPGIQTLQPGELGPAEAAAAGAGQEKPRVRVPAGSRQMEPAPEPEVPVPAQEQPAPQSANVGDREHIDQIFGPANDQDFSPEAVRSIAAQARQNPQDVIGKSVQPDLSSGIEPQAMARSRMGRKRFGQQGEAKLLEAMAQKLDDETGMLRPNVAPKMQEALDSADERFGRVPIRARNSFEKWLNNTFMGKMVNPEAISPSAETAAHDIKANRFYRQFNIFDKALGKPAEDFVAALKPEQQREIQDFLEAGGTNIKSMPEAEPALRLMRQTQKADEAEMRNSGLFDWDSFNKNWWPRQFTDPVKATEFLENYTGDLRKGKMPTLKEAQANGLELVNDNPIAAFRAKREAMYRAYSLNKILNTGMERKLLSTSPGYDHNGDPLIRLDAPELHGRTYYAPEGYATVFNRDFSKSMRHSEVGNQFLNVAQPVANWGTSLLLGLSAFHPFTMMNEGFVNQVQKGMQEIMRDPAGGLKTLALSPGGSAKIYSMGRQVAEEWQNPGSHPELTKLVNRLQKVGANPIGRGGDVGLKMIPTGFRQAIEEIKNMPRDLEAAWGEGNYGKVPLVLGKNTMNMVGSAMHAISEPLFGHVIPMMKMGAFRENLGEWLKQNPNADDHAATAAADKLWKDIENRFGIMNHDNIFWDKRVKEGLNLAMTSMSWSYGFGRNMATGVKDWVFHPSRYNMKSPEYNPNMGSVLALGITVAAMSAAYQFLKTGEAPKSPYDLIAGRTGGKTKHGQPERALMPGFQKDIMGWLHDPLGEAQNKLGVVPKTLYEMTSNKGWIQTPKGARYGPLTNPEDSLPKQAVERFIKHPAQNLTPIGVQAFTKPQEPGSNISFGERLASIRNAPKYVNPGGNKAEKKFEAQEYKRAHPH